jgi:outer membrane lipoprotein-sorting protein
MKKFLSVVLLIALSHLGFAQSSEMQASIAAIKKNLSESGAKIRNYEWIETTTVYYGGEIKSKTTKQCYYGVDGKLNKVTVGEPAKATKSPGGLRGKAAANK